MLGCTPWACLQAARHICAALTLKAGESAGKRPHQAVKPCASHSSRSMRASGRGSPRTLASSGPASSGTTLGTMRGVGAPCAARAPPRRPRPAPLARPLPAAPGGRLSRPGLLEQAGTVCAAFTCAAFRADRAPSQQGLVIHMTACCRLELSVSRDRAAAQVAAHPAPEASSHVWGRQPGRACRRGWPRQSRRGQATLCSGARSACSQRASTSWPPVSSRRPASPRTWYHTGARCVNLLRARLATSSPRPFLVGRGSNY
jgi:hypothetical protein